MNIPKSKKGYKYHKFEFYDVDIDKCRKCDIYRKRIPNTGAGYDIRLVNKFINLYSRDKINWTKEFINCGI